MNPITSRWTAWWTSQAARINAIGLRQRMLLFVTVVAGLGAVANWAWLSPAQRAHDQLLRQMDLQAADVNKARVDLAAMVRPVVTNEAERAKLVEINAQLTTMRQTLSKLLSSPTMQSTPLTELLVHLLQRQDGLTVLHAITMNPVDKAAGSAAPTASAASADAAAVLADGLMRQGLELTVTGPYAELTRYVQTLEQALPQVRWGTMWLRSEQRPPELTLQLYLVEAKTP